MITSSVGCAANSATPRGTPDCSGSLAALPGPAYSAGMNVLVLNCGSSSVKFQLVHTDRDLILSDSDHRMARGQVERLGGKAILTFYADGRKILKSSEPIADHDAAIDRILKWIISPESEIEAIHSTADIHAVGHRVVHGGEAFQASTRITPEVIDGIVECIELAPLHNPANLKGIAAITKFLGDIPQVAVFDTAFHASMPAESYLYAIPYSFYRRHRIRRYGFHGTSHRYIAYRYRKIKALQKKEVRILSLHLGNGCSACAVVDGRSLETSMGMTPLEGLVMGTRSGDLDPSILEFLGDAEGMSAGEVDTLLNKSSGLLGMSGLTGDMRDLLEEREETGDRRATLAIAIFCLRVKKYIGAYLARMGGADAIVFTGGIGENSPEIRKQIVEGLEFMGIRIDPDANARCRDGVMGRISVEGAHPEVHVIPTNEELLIARDTIRNLD